MSPQRWIGMNTQATSERRQDMSMQQRIRVVVLAGIALALCLACVQSASAQSAEPLQTVIPVSLDVAGGNITVGSTVYTPSQNPGLHMVALKRQPGSNLAAPDLIANQTFTDASSANQFLENVLAGTPDALLILNAVGNYGFGLSAIAPNLEQFGSAHDIEEVSTAIPFVFIGNGGLNSGQAHQSGFSTRDMSGYLATDSNGTPQANYTFIQPDYVTFHLTTDGTIQIGATTYTVAGSGKVPGCDGTNAFHVVAVQRDAPDMLIGNESYCTAAQPDSEITHLHKDLSGLAGSESNLVFIVSAGHPIPADWNFGTDGDVRIYPLAQVIAQLGGYFETVVYLTPADTYSLVGAAAPPAWVAGARKRAKESSSVYPGYRPGDHPTGELHGVLARGLRGNWYSPLSTDPTGQAGLGFYEILAQQPVPFPHPANEDELNAFQSIVAALYQKEGAACANPPCNVRDLYADTNIDIGGSWLTNLENLPDPTTGNRCGTPASTPFCIVQQQLVTEFSYVGGIRALNTNLDTLWTASGTNLTLELESAYNTVQATLLPPPPSAPAPSLLGPIVNLFLGLGSLLPDVGPVFGLADTVFNFATSLTTDPSGNPAISATSTVGQLEQQAVQHFNQQATARGTQFQLIYQDWGKLSALGAALASAPPGSPWYWDGSTTTGQILSAMAPAMEQSSYQSLMAALYAIGSYVPGCSPGYDCPPAWGETPIWMQPQSYLVYNENSATGTSTPFDAPPGGVYVAYTFPTGPNNPNSLDPATGTLLADNAWLGISAQTTPSGGVSPGVYEPPSPTILTHLLTARSEGGLGVYRPAFFEGWPFPRVTCDVSVRDDGNDPGQGCDWGSAALPPEALPAPITRRD
jgi:hypothetical protein